MENNEVENQKLLQYLFIILRNDTQFLSGHKYLLSDSHLVNCFIERNLE